MEAFNSMAPPLPSATPGNPIGLGPGVVDELDPSIFDEALMSNVNSFPDIPFTPSYDFQDFSAGFEDPFSYTSRQYETQPLLEDLNQDSPSHELDNKLLGFSPPLSHTTLIDDTGQHVDLSTMSAELRGMFFVAEDVFGGENTGRPLELTCYRRNLWQCLGEITIPRHITHLIDEQGKRVPVDELAASICGVESIEGKPTEIISIPWKSGAALAAEELKTTAAPPRCPLDPSVGQEVDASRITFNISWKRLQFKHATANNGRRKGLQQHYVVQIHILARPRSGDWVSVAQIQSSPVIVRGRSPRNFDSKKDVFLSRDKKTAPTPAPGAPATLEKQSNSDVVVQQRRDSDLQLASNSQRYHSIGSAHHANEWATPQPYREQGAGQQQPSAKRLAMSPSTVPRPPVPSWSADPAGKASAKTSVSGSAAAPPSVSGPINLSLSEDERSSNRSSSELQSPRAARGGVVSGLGTSQSPEDEEDMLYEYFPLSVDDWMPPVDAVYRPHVVHHTIVPAEVKAQQMRTKMKRYFTAES